jgi:hypothetical protein
MIKGFDFWRAVGVSTAAGFVAVIVYLSVTPFVESSLGLFLAKEIVLSAAIAAFFAWVYFHSKSVKVSLNQGLLVGVVMLALPFLGGFFADPNTMPELPFEENFLLIFLADAAAVLIATALTGYYVAKQK